MATSGIQTSLLSRLSSAFCKPVDGAFTLDGYVDRSLIIVGDRVRVRRRVLPDFECTVVALNTHRHVDNFESYSAIVEKGGSYRQVCLSRVSNIERRDQYRDHWIKIHEFGRLDEDESYWTADRLGNTALISIDFHTACIYLAHGQTSTSKAIFESIVTRVESLKESAAKATLSGLQELEFPSLLKRQVYANALLGKAFDVVLLCDAARMMERRSEEIDPFNWGGAEQDEYLAVVRAAIIADDIVYARELLKSKRSFSKHRDQRALLKKLVRKSVVPADDRLLADRCRHYLDFVRRPHVSDHAFFSGNLQWLDWGLIVDKSFRADHSRPTNWEQIVRELHR